MAKLAVPHHSSSRLGFLVSRVWLRREGPLGRELSKNFTWIPVCLSGESGELVHEWGFVSMFE